VSENSAVSDNCGIDNHYNDHYHWPNMSVMDMNVAQVEKPILEGRRVMIHDLSAAPGMSVMMVHDIVHKCKSPIYIAMRG